MHSHQSNHVFIGAEASNKDWIRYCEKANKDSSDWVIQERITSDKKDFIYGQNEKNQYKKSTAYVFSPYFFGDLFGSALIRVQQGQTQVLSKPTNSPTGFASIKVI